MSNGIILAQVYYKHPYMRFQICSDLSDISKSWSFSKIPNLITIMIYLLILPSYSLKLRGEDYAVDLTVGVSLLCSFTCSGFL